VVREKRTLGPRNGDREPRASNRALSPSERSERNKTEPSAQASAVSEQSERTKRKGPFRLEWALGSATVRIVWSRTDTQGRVSPPQLWPCGLVFKSITASENHNKFIQLMNWLRIAHRFDSRHGSSVAAGRANRVVVSRSERVASADCRMMNTFSLTAPLDRPGISELRDAGAPCSASRTEISR
jgi:hypothetical protein